MPKRKPRPLPVGWTRAERMMVNGRAVEPGTELSIKGERGRFRFVYVTETADGRTWVDVIGGTGRGERAIVMWRSFAPERIKVVHRVEKDPKNLLRQRKAAKQDGMGR